ncbi:hypothetical protein M758_2G021700 [Ceratodon purpureus]|nr:hypothetical protein M758_2G021700 [Ceratodon purpureus]
MASYRILKPILWVGLIMAMLLVEDVTAVDNQMFSPDVVAGLTQQAYFRGNTDVSGSKKGAVVTEEMHVGDPIFDSMFDADYSDGRNPSANCRRNCPRRPRP